MPLPNFRPAQAGDLCLLLLPTEAELAVLNEHQRFLAVHFGGQVHTAVHLTIQRFAPPPQFNLQTLSALLLENFARTPPLTFTALSAFSVYSNFKLCHIVKWEIAVTPELRECVRLTNWALDESGVERAERYADDWLSTWVTALDGVTHTELTGEQLGVKYPRHLFTARRLWFSEIKEGNGFEVLARVDLPG